MTDQSRGTTAAKDLVAALRRLPPVERDAAADSFRATAGNALSRRAVELTIAAVDGRAEDLARAGAAWDAAFSLVGTDVQGAAGKLLAAEAAEYLDDGS